MGITGRRAIHLLHHPPLLVHLDGVDRRIVRLVLQPLHGLGKGTTELVYPILQNIGKAHQQWRSQTGFTGSINHIHQRHPGRIRTRAHVNLAFAVDIKIAITPVVDAVGGAGRFDMLIRHFC